MRGLRHAVTGAAAGCICLALAACNVLGAETTVSLELPGAPDHWPASIRPEEYRVVWRGDTGDLREVTVAGGVSGVELAIPKRPGLAVLAYPSFAGGAFITRPAAAVYPHDMVAGTRLAASYARGFTGLVLHRVLFALPSVNSGRLIDEVRARSEGNPWSFDLERVVRKVADGRFSTIYLRPRDAFAVEVEVGAGAAGGSAASAWLPHNPLADVVVATDSPEGSMLRTELPPGHHHLMGVESGCILSVVVEEDGSYRVFRR